MDPLVGQIVALGMTVLWVTAAIHKVTNFVRFRQVLHDYKVLPPFAVAPISVLVTTGELLLAGCWLFRVRLDLVSIATIVLLATYTVALAVNLSRGRVFIDCGCGFSGSDEGQTIAPALLVRNGLLIMIAAIPLLPVSTRSLQAVDYLVAAAVLVVSLLLFAASSQLIRNRAAIRSWRAN